MRTTVFSLALIMGLAAGPVFASQCPAMMAQIDEALQTADVSDADRERVMELRQQGEDEHNAGDHAASEASLGEAMDILGIN